MLFAQKLRYKKLKITIVLRFKLFHTILCCPREIINKITMKDRIIVPTVAFESDSENRFQNDSARSVLLRLSKIVLACVCACVNSRR